MRGLSLEQKRERQTRSRKDCTVPKGTNRSGSDAARRAAALAAKGREVKDRGGKNIGIAGEEHSRIPKGNRTQHRPNQVER
jgi:hypothetical protein